MSTAAAVKRTAEQVLGKDKIISSDSHIMEPVDLWEANLTASLKAKFPKFPPRNTAGEKPGGHDPKARFDEMAVEASAPKFCMRRTDCGFTRWKTPDCKKPVFRSLTIG